MLASIGCTWITDEEWATRADVYTSDCEDFAWWLDADGDGYGGTEGLLQCAQPQGYVSEYGDCDDQDPSTNPGATERCDGVNNDCDAKVDEDAVDARTYYRDKDGDGFGDVRHSTQACTQPQGTAPAWVPAAGDCDDADAAISPAATELCDALDNDCDGSVDVGAEDALTWYEDADSDGYGAGEPDGGCEQPVGTATADGDCDDASSDIHPGADEVCGDGIDNDCDGAIAPECLVTGVLALQAAEAWLGWEGAASGGAVAGAGDLDGDGLIELLVASPGAGAISVVSAAAGLGGALADSARLVGPESTGEALSGVGDQDRDGYSELLVGAPDVDDSAGTAWLIDGAALADGGELDLELDPVRARFVGSGRLGVAVSGASTVDDDFLPDLLLGADQLDDQAGAAYLFYGPVTGGADGAAVDVAEGADATLMGAPGDRAGRALTGAGDVDGDGLGDLLVGAPGASPDGALEAGEAWLVPGPVSGLLLLSDVGYALTGSEAGELAGCRLASAGDNDGDGYSDLMVGAFRDGAGLVALFNGPITASTPLTEADATLSGAALDEPYDTSLSALDFDRDGLWDLFVGAPAADDAGALYGLLGPVSGAVDLADADLIWLGLSPGDRLGASVRRVNDANGDGYPEVLVGAPGAGDGAGAAWLLQAAGY